MRNNRLTEKRPTHPNRQHKSKSALAVEPVKHKSPATSAFLNRIKAIQILRNEKCKQLSMQRSAVWRTYANKFPTSSIM